METRTRTDRGHTEEITVTRGENGWEVRETRDSRLVKAQRYSDWHRVERAVLVFERQSSPRAIPPPPNEAPA